MWTMLEGFEHLAAEEIDVLIEAPVLITVLIGAADGTLDREERSWTEKLMRTRTYSKTAHLVSEYYRVVAEGFLEKVDATMAQLPADADARNQAIAEKLSAVNPVLAKLDLHLAASLYKSYVSLAQEAAKASGGFLRIGSVSAAEYEWLKLPMIQPVEWQGEQEEAEEEEA
ncbi:MAG: hypothetical protein IT260_06965 [Saprospiraceae bacterium]|nr:hypothetical protein [Saprospiraceae bacterium]